MTWDTVVVETPASRATSLIVARIIACQTFAANVWHSVAVRIRGVKGVQGTAWPHVPIGPTGLRRRQDGHGRDAPVGAGRRHGRWWPGPTAEAPGAVGRPARWPAWTVQLTPSGGRQNGRADGRGLGAPGG